MSRLSVVLVFALLAVCLYFTVAVEAKPKRMKQQAPVPLHYRKPLIDTSATSSPDKTESLAKIAKIIAKEPIAARLKPNTEATDAELDLYNGEDITPEDKAARQARIIRKEIKSLKALIKQGKAILKILPKKEKRLSALQARLKIITSAKAKKEAAEKLEAQQQLLKDIAKQEKAMRKRLDTLKSTQARLNQSISKVKKVVVGGKGKKGKKGKGKKSKGKKGGKGKKGKGKKGKGKKGKGKKGKGKKGKGKKGKGKKGKGKKKFYMFRAARPDVSLDSLLDASFSEVDSHVSSEGEHDDFAEADSFDDEE